MFMINIVSSKHYSTRTKKLFMSVFYIDNEDGQKRMWSKPVARCNKRDTLIVSYAKHSYIRSGKYIQWRH